MQRIHESQHDAFHHWRAFAVKFAQAARKVANICGDRRPPCFQTTIACRVCKHQQSGIGSQVINALFSLLCVPKHSPTCANDGYPACNFIQKLHFSHRTLTLRTSDANCPGPVFIKCLCLGQPVLLINSATCQSFVHVIGASTRDSDDYTMCHNSCFSPQRKNTIRRSN